MSPTIRKSDAKDYGIETGCGKMGITFRLDKDKEPVNCKIAYGKSGVCGASQTEAISRLVKICLKHNIALEEISKQLKGIRCNIPKGEVHSCPDAVGRLVDTLKEDLDHIVDANKKVTE